MPSKKVVICESGKRKTAIARATIKAGNGRIRINKTPIEILTPDVARSRIIEPILLSGEIVKNIDIDVNVKGGGFMGQAEAARTAIAKATLKFAKNTALKRTFLDFDRNLLIGDHRRKESKKFGGPGARRKKQKSYR